MNQVSGTTYADEEVSSIYRLGRFFLENGDLTRAESLMQGLVEVAPHFAPAWLGVAYVAVMKGEVEHALSAVRQALKIDGESVDVQLFLIACLLTAGDYNAAGSFLGEVQEKIDRGEVANPDHVRFYQVQLARYQYRAG